MVKRNLARVLSIGLMLAFFAWLMVEVLPLMCRPNDC